MSGAFFPPNGAFCCSIGDRMHAWDVDKAPRPGSRRRAVRLALLSAVAILAVVTVLIINRSNDARDVADVQRPTSGGPAGLPPLPAAAVLTEAGWNSDIEQKIQKVLQATDLEEAQRNYRALFKAAGVDGQRALRLHQHDGIALQAAWEEVILTVPEDPERAERPEKLEWFLSFLQRRMRSRPPEWWGEMLLDARANRRDSISFPSPKKRPYHDAGLDRFAPHGTTMKMEDGKVVLTIGDQSATIPEDILLDGRRRVSGLITPKRCYVAVHDNAGLPYQLVCIDRASAKVLWKTEVWAAGHFLVLGPLKMWVAVSEQNGRVVLFGAGNVMIYVEAFRADNGANLFRFAGGTDWARLSERTR